MHHSTNRPWQHRERQLRSCTGRLRGTIPPRSRDKRQCDEPQTDGHTHKKIFAANTLPCNRSTGDFEVGRDDLIFYGGNQSASAVGFIFLTRSMAARLKVTRPNTPVLTCTNAIFRQLALVSKPHRSHSTPTFLALACVVVDAVDALQVVLARRGRTVVDVYRAVCSRKSCRTRKRSRFFSIQRRAKMKRRCTKAGNVITTLKGVFFEWPTWRDSTTPLHPPLSTPISLCWARRITPHFAITSFLSAAMQAAMMTSAPATALLETIQNGAVPKWNTWTESQKHSAR